MRILDSRRLTGPSLLLDEPGAILDVALDGVQPERAAGHWSAHLERYLAAMGWAGAAAAWRAWPGGMSLAFAAPLDALYTATEVNEYAWICAAADLGLRERPAFERSVAELLSSRAKEANPTLAALACAAAAHGVSFLCDDKRVSVGLGRGSRTWPADRITTPDRVRWKGLHDVPVAIVTGTNGKTTTVRLLGAMARAAGLVAGTTSTDGVDVGEQTVARGDYSGPNGARTVLRDRRVELAVLETARGGLLRRGLAVRRARAALVTNVASDHLGEFGIHDLGALADAKLVVAKAVGEGGRVVLNADDPLLLERGRALGKPVAWFAGDGSHAVVREHAAAGGDAAALEAGTLALWRGGERHALARVDEVPIALGGAARHNLANALAASATAAALGLPAEAIARGLREFQNSFEANPGRGNLWELGGVRALVDFAHNPHGMETLVATAAAMPARRRLVVLGQAGDRDDDSIRELARLAWRLAPARVILKEMEKYLRGRERGAVTAVLEDELRRCGALAGSVTRADTELEAVRQALEWSREGDLLVLPTHAQREDVVELLGALAARGWRPGEALPTASEDLARA